MLVFSLCVFPNNENIFHFMWESSLSKYIFEISNEERCGKTSAHKQSNQRPQVFSLTPPDLTLTRRLTY